MYKEKRKLIDIVEEIFSNIYKYEGDHCFQFDQLRGLYVIYPSYPLTLPSIEYMTMILPNYLNKTSQNFKFI